MAGDTEFFSLYEEELGGTRPDRLYEVRPQERVQRRTVEQNVDNSLFLPTLDVPVPQMVNQLVEVCRLFDVLIPEQAIAVPKISSSRNSLSRRQNSWWKCRRSYAGLWSRTWIFQFLVVVVVSVSVYTQDRVQQRLVEQNFFQQRLPSKTLTFQFLVVAEIFLLQRRLPVCRVRQIKGFSALFPRGKKCEGGPALESEGARQCQPIHAVGSAGGFLH